MKHKFKKRIITLVVVLSVMIPAVAFADGESRKQENAVTYNAKNEITNGTVVTPSPPDEDHEFAGWATTKEIADAGRQNFNPLPSGLSNKDLNQIKNGEIKRVYAVWKEKLYPKYAVSIYKIDSTNRTITFGPATGDYSVVKYSKAAHIQKDQETSTDKCIHNHTWREIIDQIKEDPTVFNKCIDKECRISVKLRPREPLQNMYGNTTEEGDGASILGDELKGTYRQWNFSLSTQGGWPASRIRAVLNGCDDFTNTSVAGDDITKLNEDNCLLSWFPSEIKNAIEEKKSGEGGSSDKLWLFSGSEISESRPYSYDNVGYTSNGETTNWWLRTVCDNTTAYYINGRQGYQSPNKVTYGFCIAPGFVVSGK